MNNEDIVSENTDWLAADREHEQKMAQIAAAAERKEREYQRFRIEQRTSRIGTVAVVLGVVAVLLGITFAIWNGTTKGSAERAKVEAACLEDGGTWVLLNGYRACLRLGTVAEVR